MRLTSAKLSYRDGPKGAGVFERKSQDTPPEKRDVRLKPTGMAQCSIGVLVPANAALVQERQEEEAWKALLSASRAGQIRRGAPSGPRKANHASQIVETALGLKPSGGLTARVKAERIVEGVIRRGLATVSIVKEHRHDVEILVPAEPFEAVDETPY